MPAKKRTKAAAKRASKKQPLTPKEEMALIRQRLGHIQVREQSRYYLHVDPELHAVLGNKRGLVFGKIVELFGMESEGKSLTAQDICAAAQNPDNIFERVKVDGKYVTRNLGVPAIVVWLDVEATAEKPWFKSRGVDPSKVRWIEPFIGLFNENGKGRKTPVDVTSPDATRKAKLATAEDLCQEAEELIKFLSEQYPGTPIVFVIDSVTAFLTRDEDTAGVSAQNMRSKMGLPMFLGQLFRRWVAFMRVHNVLCICISQLRINPRQMFGNPEYVPGGKAVKFYAHIRAKVKRAGSGGRLLKAGKQIGIVGFIRNVKNKVGGVERTDCGFKAKFKGGTVYTSADAVRKDKGEGEGE